MSLTLVGLSFRTAPVAARERLALTRDELRAALARHAGEGEIAVLATCNRFEVYLAGDDADRAHAFIAAECRVDPADIAAALYVRRDAAAVGHLLAVAAGLDSLVLGEAQILGQVGDAVQLALGAGAAGRRLAALFRRAIVAGRRVRSETALGQGAGSLSNAAVALARQQLGELRGKQVLLVGAGKMAELTARALSDHAVGAVHVLNRQPERARAVAQALGGAVLGWDDLPAALAWADVVITSTGAPHTLIHVREVARALRTRPERPLAIIDLAVPRDVDPAVAQIAGVFLADMDALQERIELGLAERAAVVPQARAIVAAETAEFMRWLAALDVTPTIAELRGHAERIRDAEVRRALRRLADLSPQERQTVEALSVALVNKLLHAPTIELKRHAADPRFASTARQLFALDGAPDADPQPTAPEMASAAATVWDAAREDSIL